MPLLRRRQGLPPVLTSDLALWPLRFGHVVLTMTYFSTGATKLLSGGFRWMNGYTLQNYVLSDAIDRHIPLGLWVAQHYWLCVALSVGTIVFELFYFVSLLLPRVAPLFFFGGVLFLALIFTASRTAYRVWRKASSPDFHRPEYLAAIGGFSVSAYFLSHAYFWAMFGIVALIAGTALIGSESGVRAPVVTANYRRQPGFRSRHWQRPPQRIA